MRWQLDDLPVFLAVIEQGGVTAAARHLGWPKSTVSSAVTRLEQALGLRLLDRVSRRLRVTAEGEAFARQAQLIVEQAREADALMAGLGAAPAGRLAVALPPALTQERVAPRLAQFKARHPQVELDIVVTTHGESLLGKRVDLAVVVGQLDDSERVCRPLLSSPLLWVASPAWAQAHPPPAAGSAGPPEAELALLRAQVQLCETRYAQRRLPVHVRGEPATLDLSRGCSHVNDPLVVRRAVMAGAGVSVLPRHYCEAPLAEGRLVEVFPHITFELQAAQLSVVYPGRRLLSPRVRVFLEFLTECCAPEGPAAPAG
ncbi:LysR family transcriptional regulator [Ideonella sp. TBM-1]|uniref:LysR family transcriptional regulator n=1 Tax=Ideonella livida TaxID=2707176 RepID=A0A7C9PJX6_9BURK|nr:LysR family transcriptional regulator [Ideonella livida]